MLVRSHKEVQIVKFQKRIKNWTRKIEEARISKAITTTTAIKPTNKNDMEIFMLITQRHEQTIYILCDIIFSISGVFFSFSNIISLLFWVVIIILCFCLSWYRASKTTIQHTLTDSPYKADITGYVVTHTTALHIIPHTQTHECGDCIAMCQCMCIFAISLCASSIRIRFRRFCDYFYYCFCLSNSLSLRLPLMRKKKKNKKENFTYKHKLQKSGRAREWRIK